MSYSNCKPACMRIAVLMIAFSFSVLFVRAGNRAVRQTGSGDSSLKYYPASTFTVISRAHHEDSYKRFAAKWKGVVRGPVWGESESSAGIGIRFRSNTSQIVVRWILSQMDSASCVHGPGFDGLDLYVYAGAGWQYVGTGTPKKKSNQFALLRHTDTTVYQEYLLNLPLYNGCDSLSIGVDSGSVIAAPAEKYLLSKKPIVYYGSSIAQGAFASRPGMAFTNIMERKLDRQIINFGFSGEGTYDISVGQAMVEVDASMYVIDCMPNSKVEIIHDSCVKLVHYLRSVHPDIPILLVEGFYYESVYFSAGGIGRMDDKRHAVRAAYDDLKKEGVKGLYYKSGVGMIGYDHEGTQDGVHPNDLGMDRFATDLLPVLRKILGRAD